MFSEGIRSILNENDAMFINESFVYNGICFQNFDNMPNNLNFPLFKNEDKEISNIYSPLYHLINKENANINNNEGISTDFFSKQNTNSEPLLYSFDNILDIFQKNEQSIRRRRE